MTAIKMERLKQTFWGFLRYSKVQLNIFKHQQLFANYKALISKFKSAHCRSWRPSKSPPSFVLLHCLNTLYMARMSHSVPIGCQAAMLCWTTARLPLAYRCLCLLTQSWFPSIRSFTMVLCIILSGSNHSDRYRHKKKQTNMNLAQELQDPRAQRAAGCGWLGLSKTIWTPRVSIYKSTECTLWQIRGLGRELNVCKAMVSKDYTLKKWMFLFRVKPSDLFDNPNTDWALRHCIYLGYSTRQSGSSPRPQPATTAERTACWGRALGIVDSLQTGSSTSSSWNIFVPPMIWGFHSF